MRWLSLKLLAAAVLLALAGTWGHAQADIIVRSFNAKGTIQAGQVVALSLAGVSSVELAPASDLMRIFGVAVDQNTAPVTVSQPDQKIFVATGGVYPVLVSTENGSIKSGDYLSMSSSDGIAAKVTNGQRYIVGRATQSFNGTAGAVASSKNGSPIGKIGVQLMPGRNTSLLEDTAVPAPLRRLVEAIAGKPLSASRIYAVLIIFIVTTAVALGLLWIGVRSGMIAIGRNPLSKHSIMQSLAQVIFAAAIVFTGGLLGIYLLLRL